MPVRRGFATRQHLGTLRLEEMPAPRALGTVASAIAYEQKRQNFSGDGWTALLRRLPFY